ncbi:MAG: type I glutamate--ammonia ligase [Euryarchaeota archaeon]|nr:type I glutamate--ammonia ligase [Euryarchaeota archaeon]
MGLDREDIAKAVRDKGIELLRLQFSDINGLIKCVEVPAERYEDALESGICFDLSSIQGGARTEESDARLFPDLNTFRVLPYRPNTARMICDVFGHDLKPFPGDPRLILKNMVRKASDLGYDFFVGPEVEFFIFKQVNGAYDFLDRGGYFDNVIKDAASDIRAEIIRNLRGFGITCEAGHHEVSPSQHEIDIKYTDAVATGDNAITLKETIRIVAGQHGLLATFMPKPREGINGSGMHVHQSLWSKAGRNLFYDGSDTYKLSRLARHYIGGQLAFIDEMIAILAPTINSYKRLIPGFEAPNLKCWGSLNRSALIRVPQFTPGKEASTRLELRCPDPTANPYLAFAVMLEAGLRGIQEKIEPPMPVEKDAFKLSPEEVRKYRISALPGSLGDALHAMEGGTIARTVLGDYAFNKFIESKRAEWVDFRKAVHQWEREMYLERF